jgi:hypothetical protein
MSVDLIPARAPRWLRQGLAYANYLIISLFLLYGIYAGVLLSWVSRARSFNGIPRSQLFLGDDEPAGGGAAAPGHDVAEGAPGIVERRLLRQSGVAR